MEGRRLHCAPTSIRFSLADAASSSDEGQILTRVRRRSAAPTAGWDEDSSDESSKRSHIGAELPERALLLLPIRSAWRMIQRESKLWVSR
jgi:hypothetical protein